MANAGLLLLLYHLQLIQYFHKRQEYRLLACENGICILPCCEKFNVLVQITDVQEWLATFPLFIPIPNPFPFPGCLRFNFHSCLITEIYSHSSLTNEQHLALNNQTMMSVHNANTHLSQSQNLNSEPRTVSVKLSSTYNEMSNNAVKKQLAVHAVWCQVPYDIGFHSH